MEYTENYQFREPTPAVDIVKIGDINYNSRKIDELIHSTQVSLAPAYDATRTSENPYMTGDVVMKDALMYRCLEDDVYGAWDATKWERTTAGEEGTGGSNVEANPQGTPTDDLDTIGINGTIYNIAGSGGGGNVYGAFIDTNRVIQAYTEETSQATYTAIEDCMVVVQCETNHSASLYYIDDVLVGGMHRETNSNGTLVQMIPLKKDSVLKIVPQGTGRKIMYTVYGLTFGTQNIFAPQIYSLTEREVGVWIDNKPLYQKTLVYNNITKNRVDNLPHNISNIDRIVYNDWVFVDSQNHQSVTGFESTSNNYWAAIFSIGDIGISYRIGTDWGVDTLIVNVKYTKTTDVAGSGSYNTLGVPMVHYTTDEQVVGTWIDGKTLYEKTYDKSDLTLTDNAWTNDILGTANSGINIKKYDAYFMLAGQDQLFPYSYYKGQNEYFTSVTNGDSLNVRPNMNAGVNVKAGIVTIRYTKSSS